MMTWYCFVRGEDFHLPRRSAVELVGVDEELTGPMRLGGAALIVSGSLRWRRVGRNRRDSVSKAWQLAKQFWQLRIDPLGNVTIPPDESGRISIEKLRVGAEHVGERGEITAEPRRTNEAVHLSADALHLRQTQIVDLLRSACSGRLNSNVVRVPRRAVGQSTHSYGLSRPREIGVGEIALQALECRSVLLIVGVHRIGAKTRSVALS